MWYAERMNTPKIGRIYHVVDKTTDEVVKVGSTIQTLENRFDSTYRKKYSNHSLKEARTIESSEYDWYEPRNGYCPFLWHLVAVEHLEMLKMGTFRKGPLSNLQSPLDQKFRGFDGISFGPSGGFISGRKNVESGHIARLGRSGVGGRRAHELHPDLFKQIGQKNIDSGHIQALGRKNVETGWLDKIRDPEASSRNAKIQGLKNVETGHMDRMREKLTFNILSEAGKKGGAKAGIIAVQTGQLAKNRTPEHQRYASHSRWHVKRGIVSPTCELCKERKLVNVNEHD